ncbi:MAG TPA: spermidine synthase [Candidatus Limnocylindria bacterium]|nr:spermidine synthase [Candidatus Limnocylindria bacterium]
MKLPAPSGPLRLVLLSCLMLFVELALIRWTGSNVVYLSYFSNFVLLGSFLGIGIGFLRGRAKVDLFRYAPVALAFLVGLVLIFPVRIDRSGSDLIYFGHFEPTGLPVWVTLPFIFIAVAAVMAMIAEGVARAFVEFAPLDAYRYDIAGSLLGIVGFSLLSLTWAPPVAWAIMVALLFAVLLRPRPRLLASAALLGLVVLLGGESLVSAWSWSPYYKVTSVSYPDKPDETYLFVNGIPHQSAVSVETRRDQDPVYFVPYQRISGPLDRVLIVGAGTGTDVAVALSEGANHVDAVEIDPRLQQIGALRHPDRPYADPRVTVVIDDGRAFLERSHASYDLILFALPDSLTLVSGQSSLRLESYLFTVEALRSARERLAPGGAFAMYNYYREDWLIDRLAGTLATVYGHAPCLDSVGSVGKLAVLTVAPEPGSVRCDATWTAGDTAAAATPATDDHPFLYLRQRAIPEIYLVTLGLILGLSLVAVRVVAGPFRAMRGYADLFCMGAAFLLLETKNVVQFALLFGTTWFVNALVFAGVLLAVLLAIEVARRVRLPSPAVLYAALLATLALAWLVPVESLLALDPGPRFAAATVVSFAPIFLANLVFAQRFREVEASNLAFGANLLGAMLGGVLEYMALLSGYQALLIAVGLLYLAAFASGPLRLGVGRRPA